MYLREKGIRVPEEIAIAGFGDDPAASLISPSLTTYQQLPYQLGRVACRTLLNLITADSSAGLDTTQVVSGNLIRRESA